VNIDHYVRIQELQNKVQIENKQLRVTNKKLESKIEAKDRLVKHLEEKVVGVMIEKEDIIVQLKSDINLLRTEIEDSKRNFEAKLQVEKERF
jgi:archaellum component FlaC